MHRTGGSLRWNCLYEIARLLDVDVKDLLVSTKNDKQENGY